MIEIVGAILGTMLFLGCVMAMSGVTAIILSLGYDLLYTSLGTPALSFAQVWAIWFSLVIVIGLFRSRRG